MNFVRALALCMVVLAASPGRADDVELRSIYARNHDLNQLIKKEDRGAIFVFARPGCPAVELAAPHLKALYNQMRGTNVPIYAIYSYSGVNIREMAANLQDLDLPLRGFVDIDQKLSKKWGVKRTAEAVLVDNQGTVLYKGAILEGDRTGRTDKFYLKMALNEFLAGKAITIASTPGQGCPINTRPQQLPKGLTFYKDILPIIQAKCQRCHRPGEVAPMSLLTYDDVVNNAPIMAQVIEDRTMPPWPGDTKHKIKDAAGMSNEQVKKVLGWIADDMPEGNPKDAPPEIQWPDPKAWRIDPNMTFKTRAYTVPATGVVPYIYTRHPIAADQDVFLEALELKPGARRTVHHMAIHEFPYSDKPMTAVDLIKIYGLEISNTILGAYVPGIEPRILPPGHAIRIKKGMGILMDAHYTPWGKQETDVSTLGIRITKTPPKREVFSRWFYRSRGRFMIPAGDGHHEMVRDDISFENDIEILAMRPHMHARGKAFIVEKMQYAGQEPGKEKFENVLNIPRWDFNWQYDYNFETPLRLNGGESLRIRGVWDNTDFNPTNPEVGKDAIFGEQTSDEMMGLLLVWRNAEKEEVKK